MKKHRIISLISITLLLLLSFQTVIGKNTLSTTTPLNSPLFDKQHKIINNKTSNSHFKTHYLGSNKNDSTYYHFIQKPPILFQTITLLKKYVSNQAIINVITQKYQNKNANYSDNTDFHWAHLLLLPFLSSLEWQRTEAIYQQC